MPCSYGSISGYNIDALPPEHNSAVTLAPFPGSAEGFGQLGERFGQLPRAGRADVDDRVVARAGRVAEVTAPVRVRVVEWLPQAGVTPDVVAAAGVELAAAGHRPPHQADDVGDRRVQRVGAGPAAGRLRQGRHPDRAPGTAARA